MSRINGVARKNLLSPLTAFTIFSIIHSYEVYQANLNIMFVKWLKEYFSFTKKERAGVVTLLLILVIVWFLPDLIPRKNEFDGKTLEALEKQALVFMKPDSSFQEKRDSVRRQEIVTGPVSLFYFDPNSLSVENGRHLGMPEKTVRMIQNYVAHGGKFRKPEDLQKIYGLRPELCEKLLPFVRIRDPAPLFPEKPGPKLQFVHNSPYVKRNFDLDVNTADTGAWVALPGIGSKLATRIVNFRDKLGGFYAVAQVGETFGLQDSVFQSIKKYLHCEVVALKKMDLNTVSLEELKNHPYLRQSLGNAIYQYRVQHGRFSGLEELKKITVVTEDIYTKITPYLTVR